MGRFYRTTAAVVVLAVGAGALAPFASGQQPVVPRPMPRSSQGGIAALEGLLADAPGYEAQGLRAGEDARSGAFTSAELADLVAPVALYPDTLLAQILVASTHPVDIVQAERLLDESETLSDEELSVLIAEQDWDPSVMVLVSGFPEVIRMLADDLGRTDDLGQAMLTQDGDVLAAIQQRRREAYSAGNLVSNQAQRIDRRDDQITIQPTDPERIYVPHYDSTQVYSTRSAPPPAVATGQNPLANPVVAGAIAFGGALLVSQLFGGDDDDKDRDRDRGDSWRGYWDRDRAIDWRDRQVYARPGRGDSWRSERDRYWDRSDGHWRRDLSSDQRRIEARREAVRWLEDDNDARDRKLKALRERERDARRDARRLEDERREHRARLEERRGDIRPEQRRPEEREQKAQRQAEKERKARRQDEQERKARRQDEQERKARQQAEERRKAEREVAEKRKAEDARKPDRKQDEDKNLKKASDGKKASDRKSKKPKCPEGDRSCR